MRIRLPVLFASWVVLGPGWVEAQQRQLASPFEHGTQAFEQILKQRGLAPVTDIKSILDKPDKSVVILLGHTRIVLDWFADVGLRQFIAEGGAVLIASDRGPSSAIKDDLEVEIDGNKVRGPIRLNANYRNHIRECPLLMPCLDDHRRAKVDLLRNMYSVATNRPSYLRLNVQMDANVPRLDARRVFARLPPGSTIEFTDRTSNSQIDLDFGIAATHGKGRYVVLADHSVFINSMMLQFDNDNIPFAINLVNWLTEGGQRTQVIFNGEDQITRSEFNANLDYIDPPLPHPDVLGPAADRLIERLEEEDFPNRLLTQLVPPHRLLRGALLGLTIMGVAYVLYRITAGKYRQDPAVAHLPERLGDLPGPPPAALPTAAAARELARSALTRLLGHDLDALAAPQVWAPGWRQRRTWRHQVRTLWEVAVGQRDCGRDQDLPRLATELTDLEHAVAAGTIRLTQGDAG